MLVDLTPKGVTGKQAEEVLDKVGITVNKNSIPFDKRRPTITSGIRIGTPAITSRGMKEEEMKIVAALIDRTLSQIDDEEALGKISEEVRELTGRFPFYSV